MPDDRKYFDIAKPAAAPLGQPAMATTSPAPATAIPVTGANVASPVSQSPVFGAALNPSPVAPNPMLSQPVSEPEQFAAETAEVANIPVSQAPPQAPVEAAQPLVADAGSITPAIPGAPASSLGAPYGDVQHKVDAHPLFSGQKQDPVKIRRRSKLYVPVAAATLIILVGLWFINSSAGASYLPFQSIKAKNTIKPVAAAIKIDSAPVATPKVSTSPDAYKGWLIKCQNTLNACIKVPTDWAANVYAGYENPAKTQYADLATENVKDKSTADALIVSVDDLYTPSSSLKVVGLIFGSIPTYAVYDTDYINANGLKSGVTKNIIIGNYTFNTPHGMASLVGTPDDSGIKAITSISQARAWFVSADAQQVLKVVRSFYYQ